MGRIIGNISMTVDGLTDVGAWFVPDGGHDAASLAVLERSVAMLVGRTTFEGFAGYWPTAEGPWPEVINPLPKYVVSRSLAGDLPWNGTAVTGDATETVAELKATVDGDLFLSGCGELARTLIQAGLVDELRFWVHPTIGGAGNRPFAGAEFPMQLLEVTPFDSGVTLLRYAPTGGM